LGKLRILSAKEVGKILETHGFRQIRQQGSHIIYQKKKEGTTVTVVVPNYAEIRNGTLISIIRQSQLSRSFFELK
jgi:hypothetical protein